MVLNFAIVQAAPGGPVERMVAHLTDITSGHDATSRVSGAGGSDFAGSNGYVSFSIKTKEGLAPLTVINNRAGIIFDSNPVIMTNTTVDIIEMITSSDDSEMNTFYLNASPNPLSQNVVFSFSKLPNEKATLTITSLDGRVVLKKGKITSTETVDVGALPSGVYICTVQSLSGNHTVKLIKN